MTNPGTGRIDFHLHSYASNVTDYYASNSLAIPESYSDPLETYRTLKAQGMDLVTLTDHNSIDGVLELLAAGCEDVFISAEMTTTFPEDGCNIHVTVANMTEEQFAEVDRLRGNVYEMVAYVRDQIATEDQAPGGNRLAYFMTHPLMSTQNRPYGREGSLSVEHLEKALLLFPAFEIRNGTRTRHFNLVTRELLGSLDRRKLERLANEHGILPDGDRPWLKAVVGGSDDHSGINPGQTWTEFPLAGGRPTANGLVDAIRARRTAPGGVHGGPVTLAHALVKLAHDSQRTRTARAGTRAVRSGGVLGELLAFAFEDGPGRWVDQLRLRLRAAFEGAVAGPLLRMLGESPSFERTLFAEARALLSDPGFRERLQQAERTDDRIHELISSLVDRLFLHFLERIRSAGTADPLRAVKETVSLVSSHLLVSLPYFIGYSHQSADKLLLRDVRKAFGLEQQDRLLLVTDTFFDVNGVARTIHRILDEAAERGIDLTVVTCLAPHEEPPARQTPRVQRWIAEGRLVVLPSLQNMDVPEYQELQLRVVPFLELLRLAQEGGYTKMQISTPGPVGLAGLAAAKLLQIETSSTYHTSFPEYVEDLTGDISLEALTWKYMIQFYQWVDEVVVPSRFIARLLHRRGLRNRKLLVLDRWVDLERFHPRHRDAGLWARYGIQHPEERVKLLYVGRVSVEKNLRLLAQCFRRLSGEFPEAHLVVVGDGPFRSEMEQMLGGLPVTFTGVLEGDDLSAAIASADFKVFPSTTDTWGNAPLEAQASGLPIIVTDKGGPQELMEDGRTGLVVPGGDAEALLEAMGRLMDPGLRRRMGKAARAFAEEGRVDQPFSAILDSRGYRERVRALKPDADPPVTAPSASSEDAGLHLVSLR